jgi:hypothetical protein
MKAFLIVSVLLVGSAAAQAPEKPLSGNAKASDQANGTAAASSAADPAKAADIRRLMAIVNTEEMAGGLMGAMTEQIRPVVVNSLPPGEYREKLVDLFLEKFRSKADMKHLLDLLAPIYDKYLSDAEIKGLIVFYQTPLGKKTLEVMPKVMAESQAEGRKWGEGLGQEAMQEVLSEHPDLAKQLDEAQKAAGGP